MTTVTYAVTRDAETSHWHALRAPTARELDMLGPLDGTVLVIAVDEVACTARLLRVLRGEPGDFITWCARSGHRPLALPDPPPPAALTARPSILA
jgi:hypothetical protein